MRSRSPASTIFRRWRWFFFGPLVWKFYHGWWAFTSPVRMNLGGKLKFSISRFIVYAVLPSISLLSRCVWP